METFLAVYARKLRAAVDADPTRYAYGVEMIPQVVEKVRAALASGSYSKEGSAFRAACKELGIRPHTYKAINRFITNHV